MSILLYVMMFVLLLSISITSFIKSSRDHRTITPYYTSYSEASHKLQVDTAKAIFDKLPGNETEQKDTDSSQDQTRKKSFSYVDRNELRNGSRFNLAFLFENDPEALPLTTTIFKSLYSGEPFDTENFDKSLEAFLKDLKHVGTLCKKNNAPLTWQGLAKQLKKENQEILYQLMRGSVLPQILNDQPYQWNTADKQPLTNYVRLESNDPIPLYFHNALPHLLQAVLPKKAFDRLMEEERMIQENNQPPINKDRFEMLLDNAGCIGSQKSIILNYFNFNHAVKDTKIVQEVVRPNGIFLEREVGSKSSG